MAQADLITSPPLRVVTPKPKMTIYYALLIIALVAMLTACLFLYLEIRRFGGFGTVPERIASLDRTGPGTGSFCGVFGAKCACPLFRAQVVSVISVSSVANS